MTKPNANAHRTAGHPVQEKKKTAWFWWWENPTDRFSFLLVFVTFLLFGATAGLYWATRNLVQDAERTSERQLRAYLSGKPVRVFAFSPSIVAEIESTVTNHGQTPASQVHISGLVEILPYPLPNDHQFPFLPVAKSTSVVHPGGTIQGHSVASHLFAEDEIARAVNGKEVRFYIFGKIDYVDIFGQNRWTRFCSSILGGKNLAIVARGDPNVEVTINFEPCDQHNEAS
jgi:hypothetical protein